MRSTSLTPALRRAAIATLFTAGALAATEVAAQGITVIGSQNDSDPGRAYADADRSEEFRTLLGAATSGFDGGVAQVRQRFSFVVGARSNAGGAFLGAGQGGELGWSLELRVDDPLNQGYRLEATQRLRGLLGASIGPSQGATPAFAELPALALQVWEAFAPLPEPLPDASSPRRLSLVLGQGTQRLTVDWEGVQSLGSFVGTRRFLFQLAPADWALTQVNNNDTGGHAWLQFGEAPTLAGLDVALPGAGDPALAELGQFFELRAIFQPVPEPAAWLLLALGLPLLLARRTRA